MADIRMSVVKFSTPTSTGNFDITGDLDGATPKLALFLTSRHAPSGDPGTTTGAFYGTGATDGTRQFAGQSSERDAVATADTVRNVDDDVCIMHVTGGTGAPSAEASFVSFAADKVTVNFTTVDATSRASVCVLLGGADVSAYVNAALITNDVAVTGVGFTPAAVLLFGYGSAGFTSTALADAFHTFGVAVNDGSLTQKGISRWSNDGSGTDQTNSRFDSALVRTEYGAAGAISDTYAVSAFSSDGFTLTNPGPGANSARFGYVAIGLSGGGVATLGSYTTKTSTGTQAYTTTGCTPVGVICFSSSHDTVDSNEVNVDEAGGLGMSAFTAAGEQAAVSFLCDPGADPTDNEMDCKAHALQCGVVGATAQAIIADFSSITAGSFTLDYTATNGTARHFFALALGSGSIVASIGLATETDTALAVTVGGVDVGLATETDTALGLATDVLLSFAAETDTALSATAVRSYALGLATETDEALAATPVKHLGIAGETDSALSLARILTFPTETDTALSLRTIRSWAIGQATETDSVLSLTLVQGIAEQLGMATETDSALSVFQRILGMATETDEALAILAQVTDYWPFDDLQPRHIGIHKIASVIGGGTAITGREPTIASGNGFWRFVYHGIPVKNPTQRLLWRAMEVKFEGRAASILIPVFDGKQAPWPGTPGGALAAIADAAVAAGATTIAIDGTGLATLEAGMGFSAGHYYHRIQAITGTVGSVYTCTIWPKTREAIADGSSLEFGRPICRVRLGTDDAMRLVLTHHRFGEGNITFIEDVP